MHENPHGNLLFALSPPPLPTPNSPNLNSIILALIYAIYCIINKRSEGRFGKYLFPLNSATFSRTDMHSITWTNQTILQHSTMIHCFQPSNASITFDKVTFAIFPPQHLTDSLQSFKT